MRVEGKKPSNRQVQQSFIKAPEKMTTKQRAAFKRLQTRFGYEEMPDVDISGSA